ncbi:MAG: isoaspartyl peptidase/L-asparaginase [Salinibacter sp.]|uniref:isoaspartyl peptidase/L-asparaginase family protein n=1 Tax=Salinibacter sp. TaxID=2065818 RepID=UPI002FC2EDC3
MCDLPIPVRVHSALVVAAVLLGWACLVPVTVQGQDGPSAETALVIHGGAGSLSADEMSDDREEAYRTALRAALREGNAVLQDGGSALDAVQAAITTMETDTLFNAARGAVLTSEGTVELDAAIMDGATRNAGALTGVKTVRHPIRLARSIMEDSYHVMFAQDGAEAFAKQQGLELVENDYFITEARRSGQGQAPADPPEAPGPDEKYGTVGAVALDAGGNLAAGTSTGGISDKEFGRVGDSPIIGAGTYAHNASCAVSATGQGEFFIRGVAAHSVASRMRFGGLPVGTAAQRTIDEIEELGGVGGVIALDREGNIATPFSTGGMFRAYVDPDGSTTVRIFDTGAAK